jgi:hypothetical protein
LFRRMKGRSFLYHSPDMRCLWRHKYPGKAEFMEPSGKNAQ